LAPQKLAKSPPRLCVSNCVQKADAKQFKKGGGIKRTFGELLSSSKILDIKAINRDKNMRTPKR
jgi:hypothetical protein